MDFFDMMFGGPRTASVRMARAEAAWRNLDEGVLLMPRISDKVRPEGIDPDQWVKALADGLKSNYFPMRTLVGEDSLPYHDRAPIDDGGTLVRYSDREEPNAGPKLGQPSKYNPPADTSERSVLVEHERPDVSDRTGRSVGHRWLPGWRRRA